MILTIVIVSRHIIIFVCLRVNVEMLNDSDLDPEKVSAVTSFCCKEKRRYRISKIIFSYSFINIF